MGSKPPQTRKGTQGFPFQTLSHSAGNGRKKGGADAPERNNKSGFVERFPELSLFYRLFSPLDSEMICIFPYFCPYAESVREIREIFV